MCDNKHTFGKQMPSDLAMLLAFLIETVDWLDKREREADVGNRTDVVRLITGLEGITA